MTKLRPFSVEPLVALLDLDLHRMGGHQPDDAPTGLAALGEALGVSRERAKQLARDGMSVLIADRAACRVGRHPSSLWGRAWWGADDVEDVPARPSWLVRS